jgi:putative transposase
MVFYVLNRGVGRMRIFDDDGDYAAFERILEETVENQPMRICAYCLMPNHWHLVLWPESDGDLAAFMHRLTNTHVQRWQQQKHLVGTGHVYQGRYKSFPVETDEYFYQVVRYVERNALRANLVQQAEEWRWSSLWRRINGTRKNKALLSTWPMVKPRQWHRLVNQPQTDAELDALRRCAVRGQPYGSDRWVERITKELSLESTMHARGRPKKKRP